MAYHIRSYCLCCHYCALECPTGAIRYMGTQYQIDPELCVECGKCLECCNVDAIDTGVVTQPVPHEPKVLDADVVVLGAGAGGVIAAVRAAELTGGKVVVLEKAKKPGGSGWFAGFGLQLGEGGGPGGPGGPGGGEGGPGGPGGEGAPGGEMPAMMAAMMKRKQEFISQLDADLVSNANAAVRDVSKWLAEFPEIKSQLCETEMFGRKSIGLNSDSDRLLFNTKCTDNAIGPGRSGSYIIWAMLQQFDRLGIELLTETAARSLLKDEAGNCVGVIASDPGGEVRVNAKAVICLTGGFAHNDEMLKKYTPWFFTDDPTAEHVHRFAAPTNTGDVVEIGESIGAYIDYDNFYVNLFGPVHHPFTFSLFKACLEGENVCVNLNGKRFFNEGSFSDGAGPMTAQPSRIAYAIFSEKTLKIAIDRLLKGNEGKSIAHFPQDLEEELGLEDHISLVRADSLEELAEKAHINKENFLKTMADYNRYCQTGVDEEFHKPAKSLVALTEGPFYGIFGKMATDGAFGGMLVNPKAEVYKADKSGVIPGLYAAGDCAAGLAVATHGPGDDRKKAVGDMSWAIGGGFMAATNAAAYVSAL